MSYKNSIMIIGAGGSLGRNLCDLLITHKYKVVAIDINENNLAYLYRMYNIPTYIEDVQSFDRLCKIIEYEKIDLVVNCAALKHVNWCEDNIRSAININILANLELINYLKKQNKKFIYISSDKAIYPKNIYALTKQFTDYIIKIYDFKFVRGVNFLNSQGSVLDIWHQQKIYDRPFTLVDNEKCRRYFMTISHMSKVVKNAIEDDSSKIEYIPDIIYDIGINDLFDAYLRLNKIKEYKINKIVLPKTEKLIEDLNFDPNIIKLNDINEIINLINKR